MDTHNRGDRFYGEESKLSLTGQNTTAVQVSALTSIFCENVLQPHWPQYDYTTDVVRTTAKVYKKDTLLYSPDRNKAGHREGNRDHSPRTSKTEGPPQ
ncbi:hypothetical protein EVAR_9029_1 [Eumeta japonica]|uniref:Uncharacterized protein n=1 Tax=Eumeta variegata TaxID=151549 RepID=A0A4C1TVZ6_EUMVA|nr:hypothetical protein EVAR_9029_1 [Eumeta japonica]